MGAKILINMKTILEEVIENRKGHYVHALEVASTYELECIISELASEFRSYGIEALKGFFSTIAIYYIGECTEEEVYNFDFDDYIDSYIGL